MMFSLLLSKKEQKASPLNRLRSISSRQFK